MADGFLLEDGSGDLLLLEDGSGILLLEVQPVGVSIPIAMYYHLHHLAILMTFINFHLMRE